MLFFGEKLKQRREEKGLTQDNVAEFFGEDFSRQSVSRWERGETYPEAENLWILSVELGMSLDEMFSEELAYLQKRRMSDYSEFPYPGIIAGLKTFANALSQHTKLLAKGGEVNGKDR